MDNYVNIFVKKKKKSADDRMNMCIGKFLKKYMNAINRWPRC